MSNTAFFHASSITIDHLSLYTTSSPQLILISKYNLMFVLKSPNLWELFTYRDNDLSRARLFTFLVNSPPKLVNTQLLFVNMSGVLPADSRFSVTGLEKESRS